MSVVIVSIFIAGFTLGTYSRSLYGNSHNMHEKLIMEEHYRAQQQSSLAGIILFLFIALAVSAWIFSTQ